MRNFLTVILLFSGMHSFATTITASATGSWLDASTWQGGSIPGAGDSAVIPVGITVTYPVDGNDYWNNPASIRVYGTYQTTSNIDDLRYTNAVTIEVFSGGLFYDATAFNEFYLADGSSIIIYAGGDWNNSFYFPNVLNSAGNQNSSSAWPGAATNNPGPLTLSVDNGSFTFIPNAPLPLTLLEFYGNQYGDNVILNWLTAWEINVSGFDVEKGTDGIHFSTIGRVKAKTLTDNAYRFTEERVSGGNHCYRLKMIDNDDQFRYSPIITIASKSQTVPLTIYPVPADNHINVNTTEQGSFYIYGVDGRFVKEHVLKTGLSKIDISDLKDGIYYYRLNKTSGVFRKH